jgi:hypothetical protein
MARSSAAPKELQGLAEEEQPPADKLGQINVHLCRLRDIRTELADMDARTKALNKEAHDLTFRTLPDLYAEAGLRTLGLEAAGNLPAYDTKLELFVRANIAADWEDERRQRAFALLGEMEAADLIKRTITIEFDRTAAAQAKWVTDGLDTAGIPYRVAMAVSWTTLTAWVREQHTKRGRSFTPGQLDVLGAQIGTIVSAKPAKT